MIEYDTFKQCLILYKSIQSTIEVNWTKGNSSTKNLQTTINNYCDKEATKVRMSELSTVISQEYQHTQIQLRINNIVVQSNHYNVLQDHWFSKKYLQYLQSKYSWTNDQIQSINWTEFGFSY